jgi:hypothetical protein
MRALKPQAKPPAARKPALRGRPRPAARLAPRARHKTAPAVRSEAALGEALVALGRHDEARAFFVDLLGRRNSFGLLSEDIHPQSRALWGNFPQTYSMAGIINVATRLSKKWEDVWCRVSS